MYPVKITHLEKHFAEKTVFADINLDIHDGELLTLLGPSGCGKSTLLRCLAGLTEVNKGTIHLGKQEITHLPPQQRNIGMVFQSYALFPNLTVSENIAFGLKIQKIEQAEIKQRVSEILELVELNEYANRHPASLSGGQRQRVALARSLVVQPKVLLLDEPLSALDARIRKNLRSQIRTIQQELNLTTVFVTHDQEEALTMSDRIALMNEGSIVQCAAPEQLYTEPANHFAAGFIGQYNVIDKEQATQILSIECDGQLAIRPESIYIYESGRQYGDQFTPRLTATVQSHQLLGSIIRYQLNIKGVELTVDLLNRKAERLFDKGSLLQILIDKSSVRHLKG
ncbi:MAG: Vitamin B12 import ATP-binding protein BtuD [Candidatus Celerinatantimonas neptuna]|nr:MAG: Vitamin B12 import ATP-binding protein BtuD [Candidatus Celerinatantimonas neptuna]